MPEKMPSSNRAAAPNSAESFLEYLKEDFFSQHGTKVIVALLLIGAAIFAVIQQFENSKQREETQVEELGKSLGYIYAGKGDSALMALDASIQNGNLTGLNLAKAALLAGNFHLQNGSLDTAESLYKNAALNAGKAEIISAAAEHGLAVVAMERQNYPEAISLLNAFVNKYGKRTGDFAKRYAKTEPVDAVPTVPDAMWKLTLCYLETGDVEKAKQNAQRILKIYGDSPRASYAQKLLATMVEK
jgi:tetratricopeptide (TPR) repeat protein